MVINVINAIQSAAYAVDGFKNLSPSSLKTFLYWQQAQCRAVACNIVLWYGQASYIAHDLGLQRRVSEKWVQVGSIHDNDYDETNNSVFTSQMSGSQTVDQLEVRRVEQQEPICV
jgi:hypothetical protein